MNCTVPPALIFYVSLGYNKELPRHNYQGLLQPYWVREGTGNYIVPKTSSLAVYSFIVFIFLRPNCASILSVYIRLLRRTNYTELGDTPAHLACELRLAVGLDFLHSHLRVSHYTNLLYHVLFYN